MTPTRRPILNGSMLRLASWLGMLALAFQTAIPLGQAIPVSTGADGLPRTLVICSAQGTRVVPIAPTSDSRGAAEAASCVVCLSYAAGAGLDLPPAAALPVPPVGGGTLLTSLASMVAGHPSAGLPQARAPPVLA